MRVTGSFLLAALIAMPAVAQTGGAQTGGAQTGAPASGSGASSGRPLDVVILPPPSKVALPGAPRASRQTVSTETGRGAPVNGVLVLYGNERCPTNTNGEEIVVCQRRSAQEQFRIPKEVRTFEVTPQNETWAARVEAERDVGAVGVGSCSTVGANGATGCNTQFVRRQTKVRKADDRAATADLSGY